MTETQQISSDTEDTNSAQSHEGDAEEEYTRADYDGWWGRAMELQKYLEKLPNSLTDKMGMTERKQKLVVAFDRLASPKGVPDPIPEGAVVRLRTWIEHAEGFVGLLVQARDAGDSTTQAPVLVSSLDEDEWQWPWIEGWDDPRKRKRILNPSTEGDSQLKKILIGGAVLGGAFYLGNRFLGGSE